MEPDDVMHIEYEEANKLTFYAIAEQKILEIEGEPMSE